MKKIVEVSGEGLESLMGETVVLFCMNYFYTGKLIGVNTDDIILQDPKIIYETGPFSEKGWKDAQLLKFCDELYVRTASIESYGLVK